MEKDSKEKNKNNNKERQNTKKKTDKKLKKNGYIYNFCNIHINIYSVLIEMHC